MPKLWLPNVEEVLPENDMNYSSVCVPKTLALIPRFLPCLAKGDAIITPRAIDPEFTAYMAAVSDLGSPDKWLLEISARSAPYSLVESILADQAVMARLRAMGKHGAWAFEPYLQTPRVLRLAGHFGQRIYTGDRFSNRWHNRLHF